MIQILFSIILAHLPSSFLFFFCYWGEEGKTVKGKEKRMERKGKTPKIQEWLSVMKRKKKKKKRGGGILHSYPYKSCSKECKEQLFLQKTSFKSLNTSFVIMQVLSEKSYHSNRVRSRKLIRYGTVTQSIWTAHSGPKLELLSGPMDIALSTAHWQKTLSQSSKCFTKKIKETTFQFWILLSGFLQAWPERAMRCKLWGQLTQLILGQYIPKRRNTTSAVNLWMCKHWTPSCQVSNWQR